MKKTILKTEIKKEVCNAAALGAYNAAVKNNLVKKGEPLSNEEETLIKEAREALSREITNNLKDIKGVKIAAGQDIVYVGNPKTIFKVVADNEGNIGHTVKYKDSRMAYQSFLRFLTKDDLATFKVL